MRLVGCEGGVGDTVCGMDASEKALWMLIDSCGPRATIALCRGEQVLRVAEMAGRAFSAEWGNNLRILFADESAALPDVGFIGVVNGPGSFTGVRVGLAVAKGLCVATAVPLLTVSSLAVMMTRARADAAVMDAGRDEFYVRVGERESLCGVLEARESLRGLRAVCVGVETAELFDGEDVSDARSDVAAAARLLWMCWLRGEQADLALSDANYVRGEAMLYARKGF